MQSIELKGKIRENVGNKYAKKLRKEDKIPCVLYGGKENVHFSVHKNDFRHIIYTPNVYITELDIDGKKYNAILQDHQFHPVTDEVLHADFLEIFDDKKVTVNVPIKLVGSSIGIKNGGKLRQKRRTLKIMALPKYLLDHVEIDITNIDIGTTLKVGELEIENIDILDPHQSMIISIVSPRVAAKGMELEEQGVVEGEGEEETAEGTSEETKEEEKPSEE